MITVDAPFPRGTCPIRLFGDDTESNAPVVFFFMDGFGPRPALFDMAKKLAAEGYRVLLPHLFYEHLPNASLTPEGVLGGGEDRQRLMAMMATLNQAAIEADIAALGALADERLGDGAPLGATGYCLGGRYALTAAGMLPRMRFAASYHGSNLAPQGEGPHSRFGQVEASIYVGIAGPDKGFGPEEEGRLAAALRAANVEHTIETYPDAPHGFCPADLPMYRERAARKAWKRLTEGLREAFAGA